MRGPDFVAITGMARLRPSLICGSNGALAIPRILILSGPHRFFDQSSEGDQGRGVPDEAAGFTRNALTATLALTSSRSSAPPPRVAHATTGLKPCPVTWPRIRPLPRSTAQTRPPWNPRAARVPSGETVRHWHDATGA